MRSTIILIVLILNLLTTTMSAKTIPETVADIDGNVYHAVIIGTQIWMVENLKTTHYRDGSDIPNITESAEWSTMTTGAFCWYENDSKYKNPYGALYNYYTIEDSRGLCPVGWHVPLYDNWITLQTYIGSADTAGGRTKETGTKHWNSPNTGATNKSGFTGLPGGGRGRKGEFGENGNYATWWSSTSEDANYAWHWGLDYQSAGVRSNPGHKASGFSVRCIKD